MEKKLVLLTAMFALTAGLVFAQTMKNSGEMVANTEEETNVVDETNAVDENTIGMEENAEEAEMNGEEDVELNAEVMDEAPAAE